MAFQQADYVAWNLWASINRRPLLPFKYQHLGEMMSLGRARGAVTLPLPLSPPLRQALNGGLVGSLLSLGGIKCAPYPYPGLPPFTIHLYAVSAIHHSSVVGDHALAPLL